MFPLKNLALKGLNLKMDSSATNYLRSGWGHILKFPMNKKNSVIPSALGPIRLMAQGAQGPLRKSIILNLCNVSTWQLGTGHWLQHSDLWMNYKGWCMYRKISDIRRTKSQDLNDFSSRLAVVFAQSIEAGC